MRTVQVQLGDRSYPIFIGEGLLDDAARLRSHIGGKQACVVTNTSVASLYLERVQSSLDGLKLSTVILPDGEEHKNLETLNLIFDRLLQDGHNRTTTLLALGGGVVGDMTGFAAATYQRGVSFVQLPTTLLSQVDSSVGGKTGVNHRLGKNMIGAFHQPNAVLIDTEALSSLPPRELSAGIAEVIKYGLISDAGFFGWLETNLQRLLECDSEALAYAIERSCRNKADVVSRDEREGAVRAILNLGHTFGHAIENHQGYGKWLHGEAVAAGMVMALDLSVREGWIGPDLLRRLVAMLERADLPTQPPPDMNSEDFMRLMAVDKKVMDGQLRLVLLRGLGEAVVTSAFTPRHLRATLGLVAA